MLSQHTQTLQVATKGREFHDITSEVAAQVKVAKISEGLVTVHLQHTSASLVIQENADPGVRRDLERFMERVCPDGDPMFEHNYEGPDDMPAHVRTALTAVNLSIPITDGQLALGTWQGIYLWEHRHVGHRRKVTVHILGE
ncbi:MAG: secondary thiamine-phosphate synthase enzyme YjbQ [Verrucomicrobiota bacterium]|jgi:secondary thiamine-phosphate synthase enzyme|nr:secondary thiamine-phosphate synthase enzyme YjbQ [Verrucomicrobiota bacterium]